MQKIGGQFALKKLGDYMLSSPKEETSEVEDYTVESTPTGPDTIMIEDADGNELVAYRMDVEVYVVPHRGSPAAALVRALDEPEATQIFTQREGSRISGIIYVPEAREEPRAAASRPGISSAPADQSADLSNASMSGAMVSGASWGA